MAEPQRNASPGVPGLVSVVICTWNNWPDVEMAIESALQQSYRPIEVIVVDNSSADATLTEVGKRFGSRIRKIVQPNKDTAGAYNAGFDAAQGEFIQFLDGDDVLAPNKIEKQVGMFRIDPLLDIVYGEISVFQAQAGPARWDFPPTRKEDDMLMAVLTSRVGICTDLGMLFRRRALDKTGPWDENLYVEDLDYLLRAAWAGCRFGFCAGGPMGFARARNGSKTWDQEAMNRGNEAVWTKALGYIATQPYRDLVLAKLARLRLSMALSGTCANDGTALEMLRLARNTSPREISCFTYAAAWAALKFPPFRCLLRSRLVRLARRALDSAVQPGCAPTAQGAQSDAIP